jgi:hypothetical protein
MATIITAHEERNRAIPPIPPIAMPPMALRMFPIEAAW